MAPMIAPQRPALTGVDFPSVITISTPTPTSTSKVTSQPTSDEIFIVRTSSIDTAFPTPIITSIPTSSSTFASTFSPTPTLISQAPVLSTSVPSFPAPFAPIVRPPEEKPFISISTAFILFAVILWATILGKMYYELFWVDTEDEAKTLARERELREVSMEIEMMDFKTKEISV